MNVLNCLMPCILGSILHLRLVSQGILFPIVLCSVFQSQLLGWEVGLGGRVGRGGRGRGREGRRREGRGGGTLVNIMELLLQ